MDVEWDEGKQQRTLRERGVNFADAAHLDFETAMTIADHRSDYGEQRFVTYGRLHDRLHVLCWTERQGTLRVISFRKANDREQKLFASSA